jgi:hypothetical protein
MRVFLVQTARGLFSSSGGYKSNHALLRYLASNGHRVRQLCYSHSGEIESFLQTRTKSGQLDPQLRTKALHIRSKDGQAGVNVKVNELCIDDGVEAVSIDSEAFDEAFGGKMVLHGQLNKMSAEYIEVSFLVLVMTKDTLLTTGRYIDRQEYLHRPSWISFPS